MEKLLVIDDDMDLCELLKEYLGAEGFAVDAAYDGQTGIDKMLASPYDLVLLDVMLPGGRNGLNVLQYIRGRSETPVLMLTAKGDDIDRIIGLEMGADDYLAKPFNPRELLARIRAILRRSNHGTCETIIPQKTICYKLCDVELDAGMRVVYQGGELVELTSVEFGLLELLLRRAGHVVSRDELANEVLGRPLSSCDRSIDVHVSKLRKKLGHENFGTGRIKAIRGVGYLYVLPAAPVMSVLNLVGSTSGEEKSDVQE